MKVDIGDKIVYPFHGPCLIACVVEKAVNQQAIRFYQLTVLNNDGGSVFVPVDKLATSGFRPLLTRTEVPGLLEHLKKTDKQAVDWKYRATESQKLFSSGKPVDLAEIVRSLTIAQTTKSLPPVERRLLDRAKLWLVCEIAEATGMTKAETEEGINKALQEQ